VCDVARPSRHEPLIGLQLLLAVGMIIGMVMVIMLVVVIVAVIVVVVVVVVVAVVGVPFSGGKARGIVARQGPRRHQGWLGAKREPGPPYGGRAPTS
jgi:hypothetical protein